MRLDETSRVNFAFDVLSASRLLSLAIFSVPQASKATGTKSVANSERNNFL
jgi:hypothetical protein